VIIAAGRWESNSAGQRRGQDSRHAQLQLRLPVVHLVFRSGICVPAGEHGRAGYGKEYGRALAKRNTAVPVTVFRSGFYCNGIAWQ